MKTFNMAAYAEELENSLASTYPRALLHIVYECHFSEFWICDYFYKKEYDIILTPANRIYRDGSKVKKDKVDSCEAAFQHSRGLPREVILP